MKKTLFLLSILAFSVVVMGQKKGKTTSKLKDITLEDIWIMGTYMPEFPNSFTWMKDDRFYSVLDNAQVNKYSIKDEKKVATILDLGETVLKGGARPSDVSDYAFSEDETKVLLISSRESIYRHSSKEVCQVWDSKTGTIHLLQGGNPVSNAKFSPLGDKIAYVFENNLYSYDFASAKTTQMTIDGKKNEIINGATDWVYEEEFSFAPAFFWSPKGNRIAFYRFNEKEVKEFSMDMYGTLYPEKDVFKYPKAGEKNSIVDIFIYDFTDMKVVQADLGTEKDIYIPRIKWTQNNDVLAVMRLNRLQNKLDVLQVNANNGSAKTMITETSDSYIDVSDDKWIFLENRAEMLWMSEQDGFNHVYHYGMDGKLIGQITQGAFEVTAVVDVDEQNEKIYFLSTEVSPLERHLYSIGLDGKKKKRITETAGMHEVEFSSAHTYYIDTYSTISEPSTSQLVEAKEGKVVKTLTSNANLKKVLSETNMSKPEFFTFKTSLGDDLNGWMIKPANFDKKKKYPVLMYVYGGPGSQTVENTWGYYNYMWFQMLAQKGYIIVSIDGRGTGGRGAKFKKATYANMGKLEVEDQVEGAKYLKTLSFVDGNRIGIWGWSFGGYMTSLCMTRGGGIFKAGIAVAPVTNWRFYDSIYTERYLKTPQENAQGYDANSPINYAKDLQGKYLLVHGSADDNVHFQNSMEWISALVKANKQFDFMVYPNKNHSIGGGMTRLNLYTKMTNFLTANL